MAADFFTKPLQGTLFKKFRDQILNLAGTPHVHTNATFDNGGQECVGEYSPAVMQQHNGNRQSRMHDDASVKDIEGRQLVTRGPKERAGENKSKLTHLSQR